MSFPARPMLSFLVALMALTLAGTQGVQAESEKKDEDKGVWIERKNGQTLNLRIEKNNFELRFYDEEKEEIEPDVPNAMLHYTARIVRARETLFLSPVQKDEQTRLVSPRYIRAPYQFDILLVLNPSEAGEEPESYHVVFIQEAPPVTTHLPPPPAPPAR